MLKRSSIRKICLAAFCLLILLILYLFPKSRTTGENLTPNTSYTVTSVFDTVYLLDKNNYVSRLNVSLMGETITDKALEIISYMTENSSDAALIPNGFKPIIPKGTKVLSYDLRDGNFKVDFSEELGFYFSKIK